MECERIIQHIWEWGNWKVNKVSVLMEDTNIRVTMAQKKAKWQTEKEKKAKLEQSVKKYNTLKELWLPVWEYYLLSKDWDYILMPFIGNQNTIIFSPFNDKKVDEYFDPEENEILNVANFEDFLRRTWEYVLLATKKNIWIPADTYMFLYNFDTQELDIDNIFLDYDTVKIGNTEWLASFINNKDNFILVIKCFIWKYIVSNRQNHYLSIFNRFISEI